MQPLACPLCLALMGVSGSSLSWGDGLELRSLQAKVLCRAAARNARPLQDQDGTEGSGGRKATLQSLALTLPWKKITGLPLYFIADGSLPAGWGTCKAPILLRSQEQSPPDPHTHFLPAGVFPSSYPQESPCSLHASRLPLPSPQGSSCKGLALAL